MRFLPVCFVNRAGDMMTGIKRPAAHKTMSNSLGPLTTFLMLSCSAVVMAQVPTEVPPVIKGAKPVSVERIKIHGAALEGNLENNEVDRSALIFLPPSTQKGLQLACLACVSMPRKRDPARRIPDDERPIFAMCIAFWPVV